MSKYRSKQQQIDDDALGILRYKFPKEFIFREQEKDFGIDCELEKFQSEEINHNEIQKSTGVIFKAQVKGVNSGKKLELKTSPVFSKKLKTRDLQYWYKQIKIPVIIFLVDIETENIYWVEFYSNRKLREDFEIAIQHTQDEVNVHFPKSQTIPDSVEKLLEAVSIAHQRIALSTLPSFSVLSEHFRETRNLEAEISIIEEKRELAYYQKFVNSLDSDDLVIAEKNAREILENKDFSSNIKLHTILSAGRIIFNSDYHKSLQLDRYLATLVWQVDALQTYACSSENTHPLVQYTTNLMECILQIQLITQSILDQKVRADAFGSRTDNPIAMFSASLIYAYEARAFGDLKEAIDEFNKLVGEQQDFHLQIRAMGLTAPMLVQAFVPLRQMYVLTKEEERVQALENYCIGVLRTHIVICEMTSDEFHLNRNLVSLFALLFDIDGSPDYSPAKELISLIEDQDFRELAQKIHKRLLDASTRGVEGSDPTDEMEMRRVSAMTLARMEGYDLEKNSEEIGYDDELQKMIHDVLKKGIDELDLTEYLKDCQYRHIFLPEFSGVSPVADSFGLGFASARKAIMCLKKGLFGTSVPYYPRDTFDTFYKEHCKNCQDREAHPKGWKYSYEWQIQKDQIFENILEEKRKSGA